MTAPGKEGRKQASRPPAGLEPPGGHAPAPRREGVLLSARAILTFAPAALLTLLLAACGFQFQGPLSFPALPGGVWLQSAQGATPLWRALKEQLRLARVDVRAEPGEGVAILRLLDDESQESLVAISSNNLPTVTEISYRVRYSLRIAGRQLIGEREREANHTRVQDEFRVLGMERETEVLREALAEELAWQILRDLASLPAPAAGEQP